MAMTNEMIDGLLDLFFKNSNYANVGDATGLQGSGTAGSLYISLHTADPGVTGNQTTSEISYTGYARVPVARSGSGWTRSGNVVSPASTVTFGQMTAGAGGTATHAGIGSASSGTGHLFWTMALTPNIVVSTGVIPECTTASTNTIT